MRLITSSLMAGVIALSAAAPAFADPPRGHHKKDRDWGRDNDRGRDWGRNDNRGWNDYRNNDRGWNNNYRGGWYDSRNDHHNWRKGDYYRYRGNHNNFVVVHDYNRYRLPPPRYGQYYYRDNNTGDILLVAAATGLILWALSN